MGLKVSIRPAIWCLLLVSLTLGQSASADRILSEKEILSRCYAQLTGQRLPVSDPLWSSLAQKTGAQICLDLLNQVQLNSNGVLTQVSNPVHRRILKQFHDFHRDWFPTHWTYLNSFPDSYYGTVDIYDGAEPSFAITNSLFSASAAPYNGVLKGYQSYIAVRDQSTVNAEGLGNNNLPRPTRSFYVGNINTPSDTSPDGIYDMNAAAGSDNQNYISIPTPIVQVGQLIGIRAQNDTSQTNYVWTNNFTNQVKFNPSDVVIPLRFHNHFGGGILGTAPFFLINNGQGFGYVANGAHKLPRRAIMTAMNSLLCLSGPFLREADVGSFLKEATSDPNGAPFRHAKSCLRCHATMDQAALTMRGLQLGSTANNAPKTTRLPAMVVQSVVDRGEASDFWPSAPVTDFYRTNPSGRLYFRSLNGNLVDQRVSNLDGLGNALASTDDLYACAAKRYFRYFTGIDVSLFDQGDVANAAALQAMSSKDKEYHDYVLALGKELKSTGSLKVLIQRILQSDYYKFAGFGR